MITGKVDCKELNRAKCLHSILVPKNMTLRITFKTERDWGYDCMVLGVRRSRSCGREATRLRGEI